MSKMEKDDSKEFTFIKERVLPKRKQKIKKLFWYLGSTIVLAIVFGIIGRFAFVLSDPLVTKILGEEENNEKVSLEENSDEQDHLNIDNDEKDESIKNEMTGTDQKAEDEPVPEQEQEIQSISTTYYVEKRVVANLEDYLTMNQDLSQVANSASDSLVSVTSKRKGESWYSSGYGTEETDPGLVVANRKNRVLILVTLTNVKEADRITVMFPNMTEAEAELLSFDENTNIAILSVKTKDITNYTLSRLKEANLGESYLVENGAPIIAVGSPNGMMNSIDFGIITNSTGAAYCCDLKLDLFYTNMKFGKNGNGFILNMNGDVIGLISHEYDSSKTNDGVIVAISRIRNLIEQLLNKEDRTYFGVVAQDMTVSELEDASITNGIYISEVETNSPAYKAGIQRGDILLSIDKSPIGGVNSLASILQSLEAKQTVKVKVKRFVGDDAKEFEYEVTIAKKSH